MVDSGGSQINAADGTLQFDKDKLSVANISKSGSIFSLWVSEPSFSNTQGTIRFEGGNPSPYLGNAGAIISVTFKALREGTANVSFSAGQVLAADGKGTNVTGALGKGTYTITKASAPAPTPPPSTTTQTGATLTAVIDSPTHPDEDNWFNSSNPEFEWILPQSVTGVSVFFSDSPTSNPGTVSDGLISNQKYEDVEDGEWYFHIRWRSQAGWGPTTHRKVLVDTTPPKSFNIEVIQEGLKDSSPKLKFVTVDALSGMDYYEIIVDGGEPIRIAANELPVDGYQLPSLSPQTHSIAVKAYDKAGNFSENSAEVKVEGIPGAEITDFPEFIRQNIPLILRGIGAPISKIIIKAQLEGGEAKEYETLSNERGDWQLVIEDLKQGNYEFSAKSVILKPTGPDFTIAAVEEGAESDFSKPITINVQASAFFLTFGWIIVGILVFIIIILAVVIWLILWYHRKRYEEERDRLREEVEEVRNESREVFRALREEVEEQVRYLDSRPSLSKSEQKVLDKLQDALDISEELLKKEVKDVEKIVKKK
jgi:hypothetical protein